MAASKGLRIGWDVTPLTRVDGKAPTGGVPTYLRELLQTWERVFTQDVLLPFSDQTVDLPGEQQCIGPRSRLDRKWWLFGLPRALREHRVDVFHGVEFSAPYRHVCPTVMTIHDLSPWMDPTWHNGAERVRKRMPWLLRMRLADRLITPTEAVRQAALTRFRLQEEMVRAVHHGASSRFAVPTGSLQQQPASSAYFLYVGTVEPRKNLPLAIAAWRAACATRAANGAPLPRLVIAGRRRSDAPEIAAEAGLEMLGMVPDSALPALYAGAAAVLYPTRYEGFGLPVLEAMQCGAVVLTTNDPAVREVTGGDAAWHGSTVEEWTVAMLRALDDQPWRDTLRQRALERAKAFSWEKCVTQTRQVYLEAIAGFRK